jgi:hypothetical protein
MLVSSPHTKAIKFVRKTVRHRGDARFYVAGLPQRVIAEIFGWQEEGVSKIVCRYVDRTAAIEALIVQPNRLEKRTEHSR